MWNEPFRSRRFYSAPQKVTLCKPTKPKRFFEALQILKANKVIRGKQTFTNRYGINRWNLNTLEKEPSRDIFQVAWLEYLVRDYKVSPMWLITGEGSFFLDGWSVPSVIALQQK